MEYRNERSQSEFSTNSYNQRLTYTTQLNDDLKRDLPNFVLRDLIDKNYEKRKQAGHELQKIFKQQVDSSNFASIKSAIEFFRQEYLNSINDVFRKAGLMAYSAIASSLANDKEADTYIPDLIGPVIWCCRDSDSKVRYYAIESMYNIVKVCRQKVLPLFSDVFKSMIDLFADVDLEVKRAAEKLDSLLKTILVECEADSSVFNSDKFMGVMSEMVSGAGNPNVQQMLVSWLGVLDSIPNFNLLEYLSNFIEGLFMMLKSHIKEVQQAVYNFLKDVLEEIKMQISQGDVAFSCFVIEAMVKMVKDENTVVRSEAITWIYELLEKGKNSLVQQFPNALKAVLQCLSDSENFIVEKAEKTNTKLMELCKFFSSESGPSLNFDGLVSVLVSKIDHQSKRTRIAVLEWIITLQTISNESIESSLEILMDTLPSRLLDPEESIINQALLILCKIARYKGYFNLVMSCILRLFSEKMSLMETNGSTIVKTICIELGTETVYRSFAELLCEHANKEFTIKMVEVLSDLLLTDQEFELPREKLKHCLETEDSGCIEFFEILFKTFSINPGSTLTLALLVQAYKLAYEMLHILSLCNIDPSLLKQLARLVQLLDSPIFVHLRMQMLEYYKHPFLLRALYAILMFLPPSRAYQTLQHRLEDISALHRNFPQQDEEKLTKTRLLKYEALIKRFQDVNLPTHRKDLITKVNGEEVSI